jgi:hypothetical protein
MGILKRLLLVVIFGLASTTPTHVAAQLPCDQACPFEPCAYGYASGNCPGGICGECIIDWHTFYDNPPCFSCGVGEAYYVIGWQWSPPCQYLCSFTTTVRMCTGCAT